MVSHSERCLRSTVRENMAGAKFTHCCCSSISHFLCVQQSAEVLGRLNGSGPVFSGEPGISSKQHVLTSPELTHEVVISPGLPASPLSPYARKTSGEVKACGDL